ncbi:cytochrome c oxidase subunit II [Nitrosomonas sp.]|mgnify:CR=1 FL=1|uniref:cytochrome c oxidase subunit II n=1 Tax=Nitrosomonas sp. TaxID=42353 RepID=UPI0025FB3089|nr:cytochrome c oxidase subunit II [Nitrosomonas sp.]
MKVGKLMASLSSLVVLGSYSGLAISSKYNLPEPQTPIAQEIYDQHMMVLWICLAIFIGVFGVMGYSIVKHRKSVGYKAANFHENMAVEVIWTIIPVLILIAISWPATKTVIAMKDTSEADITIKATGYQWMWGYDYIQGEGEGISFYSQLSTPQDQIRNQAPKGEDYLLEVDNRVVVPTGKKIRILMTANDVIHAWWVPALGVKQDAIPGFIRDAWFKVEKPGIYRGQCAELCGKEHGFMPVIVEVMEQEKYSQWVAGKQKTASAAAIVNTALVENEASKN